MLNVLFNFFDATTVSAGNSDASLLAAFAANVGADTVRLDAAPQAAGLPAAPVGRSRMYRSDLDRLNAAMGLSDAFCRWSRDAVDETHNRPASPGPRV